MSSNKTKVLQGRPSTNRESRLREGRAVQSAYVALKKKEKGLSLSVLAKEINVSQSLISQWFSGRTRIPDKTLMWLGGRLMFNANHLRPQLLDYISSGSPAASNRDKQVAEAVELLYRVEDDRDFEKAMRTLRALIDADEPPPAQS